jgi:hypothetical protein
MHGDLHFEVVLKPSGLYHVYFSDAVRVELPAAVASEVTITVNHAEGLLETLNARIDEGGKSWVAQGRRVGNEIDSTVRVAFTYKGENYWIDLPF